MYQMAVQILTAIYDKQNTEVYVMLIYQINDYILQR